ncbi:MAG: hypothetical protein U0794_07720 [Isosphaeraceae bacterium]
MRAQRAVWARRRGYVVFEVTMGVLLLLAAMALTVRLVYLVGSEQRAGDRRLWAVQTVSNLADRVGTEPYEKITRDRVATLAQVFGVSDRLPAGEWSAEVAEGRVGQIPVKRIQLRLRWKGRQGEWETPVRLTTWVYRREARS